MDKVSATKKTGESLAERTARRLRAYYPFSEKVVNIIATFAEEQAEYESYQPFFRQAGVGLSPILYVSDGGYAVPVVDVAPKQGPSKGTIVVHLPMNNPLDPNQLYQLATIIGTNPEYRVIGFGNPSGRPYRFRQQGLSLGDFLRVAFGRKPQSSRPLIAAELSYLESQQIDDAIHVGYSYGAAKALLESSLQQKGTVRRLIVLELLSHPRPIWQLARDFKRTLEPLDEYTNRSNLDTYKKARSDSIAPKDADRGLIRPVNIAIGLALARTNFLNLLKDFLNDNPSIPVTIIWGSKSELVDDARMAQFAGELRGRSDKRGSRRVQFVRLPGLHHALANDIHLHAALIRQALVDL